MVSVTPGGKGGANSSSQRVPKSHQEGTVKGGPRVTGRSPLREACHVGLKSHRGEPARRSLPICVWGYSIPIGPSTLLMEGPDIAPDKGYPLDRAGRQI